MSQSLSPIPPPLHLHQSTIPRCDSLTSSSTSPFARILVACAHSRTPTPPHYLRAFSLLAPIPLPHACIVKQKKMPRRLYMPGVLHLTGN